jgi:hypothetical protein
MTQKQINASFEPSIRNGITPKLSLRRVTVAMNCSFAQSQVLPYQFDDIPPVNYAVDGVTKSVLMRTQDALCHQIDLLETYNLGGNL